MKRKNNLEAWEVGSRRDIYVLFGVLRKIIELCSVLAALFEKCMQICFPEHDLSTHEILFLSLSLRKHRISAERKHKFALS